LARLLIGLVIGIGTTFVMRPVIRRQSEGMENRKKSLKKLFAVPLVMSAALLSFAHGANDVANAVGPLAAIVHAVQDHGTAAKVGIPLWVMLIGAFGISFGLLLFGPKLIRMVGQEITKLNPVRAYCVALVGGDHGHHRFVAGAAGVVDPYRGGRRLRGRLLPRMARRTAGPRAEPAEGHPAACPRNAAAASWCAGSM
jgi:hypothetical protein